LNGNIESEKRALQTSVQLMPISLHFSGSRIVYITRPTDPNIPAACSIKILLLRSPDKKRAEIKLYSVAFLCIVVSLCDITIPPTMEINLLAKHLFTAHQIVERCIPRAEFSSNKTFYASAASVCVCVCVCVCGCGCGCVCGRRRLMPGAKTPT
jgi:hypothetical protein